MIVKTIMYLAIAAWLHIIKLNINLHIVAAYTVESKLTHTRMSLASTQKTKITHELVANA